MTADTPPVAATFRLRETRGADGWREIAVYTENGDLRAIITHPMTGAPWWLHPAGFGRKRRFPSLTVALAAAIEE